MVQEYVDRLVSSSWIETRCLPIARSRHGYNLVSIMDLIMFDAQRQGRLSFYMVCSKYLLPSLNRMAHVTRSRQAKKVLP